MEAQDWDFLRPVAEGWSDLHHIEAAVEVLPEFATGHRLFRVSIHGGDHARVDLDHPVASVQMRRDSGVSDALARRGLTEGRDEDDRERRVVCRQPLLELEARHSFQGDVEDQVAAWASVGDSRNSPADANVTTV